VKNVTEGARLTTTSYAILGLLALRDWTTYELAQQMGRGFRRFWSRAESNIYVEPKKLAKLGLAKARHEHVGRRRRTVYSITPKGLKALKQWTNEPSRAAPVLEAETLVKIFFNEHASKQALLGHIDAMREWVTEFNIENITRARDYVRDGGPFPDRLAQIILMGRFLVAIADGVTDWVTNAERIVASWPDDTTKADPDWEFVRMMAARPLPGESA
jgi:DNA-binding PadR family transcriptional regulator